MLGSVPQHCPTTLLILCSPRWGIQINLQKQLPLSELDPTLSFICYGLVGLANDYPTILAQWENGILNLQDLMVTLEDYIDHLTYTLIGTKTTQALMPVHRATAKCIRNWDMYLANESAGKSLTDEQWREIDSDEFMSFIIDVRKGRITLPQDLHHQYWPSRLSILLPSSRKATRRMRPCIQC